MGRALFFLAILAVIGYAVFYKNMKHNIPPPSNVEQKYIRQSGGDSTDDDRQPSNSGDQGNRQQGDGSN